MKYFTFDEGLSKSAEQMSLADSIDFVMGVIAAQPLYIYEKDCYWLLAHAEDFRDFLLSSGIEINEQAGDGLENVFYRYIEGHDYFFISRLINLLDIVKYHMFGGYMECADYFENGHIVSFRGVLAQSKGNSMLGSIRIFDFLENRKFKRNMSQRFFSRAVGLATVPVGEMLVTNYYPEPVNLLSGKSFGFEVKRFFKTEFHWSHENYGPTYYPEHILAPRQRLREEVIFTCFLGNHMGIDSFMGYRSEIIGYVPLHWVTHIGSRSYRNSELEEVKSHKPGPVNLLT
jgi:hypothetical protein